MLQRHAALGPIGQCAPYGKNPLASVASPREFMKEREKRLPVSKPCDSVDASSETLDTRQMAFSSLCFQMTATHPMSVVLHQRVAVQ